MKQFGSFPIAKTVYSTKKLSRSSPLGGGGYIGKKLPAARNKKSSAIFSADNETRRWLRRSDGIWILIAIGKWINVFVSGLIAASAKYGPTQLCDLNTSKFFLPPFRSAICMNLFPTLIALKVHFYAKRIGGQHIRARSGYVCSKQPTRILSLTLRLEHGDPY